MSTNPSAPQRQAPRAAINPPRASGGNTTPGEIAKAVREASLAAQKTTEAAINRMLEETIEANKREAAKLAEKYRALGEREAKVAKQLAELEGKIRLNEAQIIDIENRRESMEKEAAELTKISENAERFLALKVVEEKRIAERHHRTLLLDAEFKAARAYHADQMEALEFEKSAEDIALSAALSHYSPELEAKLQKLTDEHNEALREETEKPARKKRAPAKKPAAKSTKNNDEDEGSDGALPEL